jgi:hypothetical protein
LGVAILSRPIAPARAGWRWRGLGLGILVVERRSLHRRLRAPPPHRPAGAIDHGNRSESNRSPQWSYHAPNAMDNSGYGRSPRRARPRSRGDFSIEPEPSNQAAASTASQVHHVRQKRALASFTRALSHSSTNVPSVATMKSSVTASIHAPHAAPPCSPSPARSPHPSWPTSSASVPAKPQPGPSLPHATGATTSPTARPAAEAHPGDDASREPARELDQRLCCMPRTMRISRTPPSTWAVPSATKPCLR